MAVTDGQVAFASQDYASARDKLEQARTANPEQFASDNLEPRLTAAVTFERGRRSPDRSLEDTSKPNGLDTRIVEGQRFADTGKRLIAEGKYRDADAAYSSALKADAKNRDALDAVEKTKKYTALRDQGLQLNKSKNAAGAQKMLADARKLDRTVRWRRLNSTLDALPPSRIARSHRSWRCRSGTAGVAQRRRRKSIAILEPALSAAEQPRCASRLPRCTKLARSRRRIPTIEPACKRRWNSKPRHDTAGLPIRIGVSPSVAAHEQGR